MTKTCAKCGRLYDQNIKFCLDCGVALTEESPPKPPVVSLQPVREEGTGKAVLEDVRIIKEADLSKAAADVQPKSTIQDDATYIKDTLNELSERLTSIEASIRTVSETISENTVRLLNKMNELILRISETQTRQKAKDKERSA